jgi:hypothetical protein
MDKANSKDDQYSPEATSAHSRGSMMEELGSAESASEQETAAPPILSINVK